MRVLIVDDEAMIRQLAERILTRAGHETVTVASGAEAIQTFQNKSDEFDAVVLDLTLDDMTGEDCLEKLSQIRSSTKFVISTGKAVSRDDFPTRYHSQIDILLKPYKANELVDIISRVTGSTN